MGSRMGLGRWLGRPWWTGLGVIVATAVALIGYFLASGSSPTYSNRGGNCVAQGTNNVINCPGVRSGASP
jgi:hypothetical protein